MDPISDRCRLCLDPFAECFTTIDNPQLKEQMEKVFCFSIEPKQGYCSGVCQSCSYAIAEFYQYSERVRQNQEAVSIRLTSNSFKVETLSEAVLPETTGDAYQVKYEVPGEEEAPSVESNITLESVKVETLSEFELPETTEDTSDPKYDASEEKEAQNSGNDEKYGSPPKKQQAKREERPRKRKLDELKADEPAKNFKQSALKKFHKRNDEDQFFNKHFRMICDLCGTTASTFTELLSHFWKEHKRRNGYIMCCNKKLFKRYTIRDHIDFHANPDVFRCEVCGIRYMNRETLYSHMLSKHSSTEQEAPILDSKVTPVVKVQKLSNSELPSTTEDACKAKYEVSGEEVSTVDSKLAHESVIKIQRLSDDGLPETSAAACEPKDEVSGDEVPSSGDDESYEPPPKMMQAQRKRRYGKRKLHELSPTKNAEQTILKKHQKRNEEDQLFNKHFRMICDLCGTTAATFTKLLSHFWKEHKRRCGYIMCCNKKLFKRYVIRDHIKFHANPDVFRCEMCGNKYMNKDTLDIHMLSKHSSTGSLKCDLCPQSFAQKSALAMHMKRHVKVKCSKCDKSFTSRSYLSHHMTNLHSRKIICDICGKEFLNKQAFNQHTNEHIGIDVQRVQCGICLSWLKDEQSLRNHIDLLHTEANREFQRD